LAARKPPELILFCRKAGDPLARWDKLMRAVEGPFAKAVEAEKDRYIAEASANFPITRQLSDIGFDTHAGNMASIAARYDGIAIRLALKEVQGGIKSSRPLQRKEDWEKLWLFLIRRWITEFGAQRARETAATTRSDMQRIIQQALSAEEEFNPVQVAARLLRVQALSAYRADTIARTEIHGAMMFASEEGAAKLGRDNGLVLLKAWLPVHDERTRSNHAVMSSHPPVPLDGDFRVGSALMKRPGDPRGGAANCINCRCVLTYREEE